jgi:leucine dehydrogenase
MNTSVHDMDHVRMETRFVTGVSPSFGGSGDPSPVTALGVFYGILAAVEKRFQKSDLSQLKILVQGVGAVGKHLCELLHERGVKLYVSDISADRLQDMKAKYNAEIVEADKCTQLDIDVYAPCARGATLNDVSIPQLKASVVAGAANNQLEKEEKHAEMLRDRNILYAPDYVINAGGLINVSNEIIGYNREKVMKEVKQIGQTLKHIFDEAERKGTSTLIASNQYAENRIKTMKDLRPLTNFNNSAIGKLSL